MHINIHPYYAGNDPAHEIIESFDSLTLVDCTDDNEYIAPLMRKRSSEATVCD
jgi:hypothetical protein